LVLVGPTLLTAIHAKTQFLPFSTLLAFVVIYLIEMHGALYANLVYTENVNPFVIPVALSGVLIVAISLWLTPRIGVWGIILAQAIVQLSCNNWWPVVRAVRGLNIQSQGYWSGFFSRRLWSSGVPS
jgi:hypothetical protein